MQCLVRRNWSIATTTKCMHCFPLCEQISYSEQRKPTYNYGGLDFSLTLKILNNKACFVFENIEYTILTKNSQKLVNRASKVDYIEIYFDYIEHCIRGENHRV
uniref:Uncharacterized protein n=1 Tax=Megaselia scalaris TaxID=36166 RepID=T1GJG2_MEGSC